MKRKLTSIILAVTIAVAFMPAEAFAIDNVSTEGQQSESVEAGESAGSVDAGQTSESAGSVEPVDAGEETPSYDIRDYEFKLSKTKYFYDGKKHRPNVICSGLPDTAYNVEYGIDWYDEGEEGTYAVEISGNQDAGYSGSLVLWYEIVQTAIYLNKYSATLYRKGTLKLKAEVDNPNGKTTFKSSNKKVATVSSGGKVTAKAKGTATIKVKNGNALETVKIKVKNPKLNVSSVSLYRKGTKKLKITGKVGKATFKSSNKKVATVSSGGKIKAKKKGKCTITVKTNGITLKCKVKVKNPRPVYVYITRTGIRYHCDPDCYGLRHARALYKVKLSKAKKKGLTKCHVCYHY